MATLVLYFCRPLLTLGSRFIHKSIERHMVMPTMSSHDDNPQSELPLNPIVTTQEEEEEEGATKKDTFDSTLSKPPPPKKRRRSLRNTNVSNDTAEKLDSRGQTHQLTLYICFLIIFLPADRLVRSQFAPVSSLE